MGYKNGPCHEHTFFIVALKRLTTFKYVKPVNVNLYYSTCLMKKRYDNPIY